LRGVRVAITGSTGLIGSALWASLLADGHDAVRVHRKGGTAGVGPSIEWDPVAGTIDEEGLAAVDAVVHLAGEPIGAKRLSAEQKAKILDSRVRGTGTLAGALARLRADGRGPRTLVSASGVNYYGDRNDEVLVESSGPGPGSFLTDVCLAWEGATAPAAEAGVRVAIVRTGIVLDAKGGALQKMLPIFKLGLGGKFGRGHTWMPWIHIDDHVGAIRFLLDQEEVAGPCNSTAPEPVTNADFTKALGHALGRPAFLPVPPFGPKLILGSELAEELLFTSMRVHPAALEAAGYEFRFRELEPALRDLFG
jgi:uncharacterized protein (TIGR01777 family)